MSHFNSVVCGPKFTNFIRPNAEGVVVDNGFFRLLTWRSVPKIFAIKVESCQKLRRILGVFFAVPNFRGRAFRKLYTRHHPCPTARRLEKFHEDTPTRSGVIVAHTLNFRPNFKFSRLKFFGGPRSQLGCALGCCGRSLACVKISGGSSPWGPKCNLPKNVHLDWSIWATFTLLFVDQSSPEFFGSTCNYGVVVKTGIFGLSTWWSCHVP